MKYVCICMNFQEYAHGGPGNLLFRHKLNRNIHITAAYHITRACLRTFPAIIEMFKGPPVRRQVKYDMRLRRGGMDRLIRRFVAGTVLVLLLLLCGRYMGRRAGAITRNDFGQILESGGRWLVETIWNQAVPQRQEADGGSYGIGREDEIPDPDPSYRKYQTVKTFYQEHEYLAWYGNEESGQQAADEQLASVSGGAYDRGGGTQALTGPDGPH